MNRIKDIHKVNMNQRQRKKRDKKIDRAIVLNRLRMRRNEQQRKVLGIEIHTAVYKEWLGNMKKSEHNMTWKRYEDRPLLYQTRCSQKFE